MKENLMISIRFTILLEIKRYGKSAHEMMPYPFLDQTKINYRQHHNRMNASQTDWKKY